VFEEHDNVSSKKSRAGNNSEVTGDAGEAVDTSVLVESDNESGLDLHDIPQAEGNGINGKRQRDTDEPVDVAASRRASKRRKDEEPQPVDDKKMPFKTNYEGFTIYGWVLCLLVTRKGDKVRASTASSEPSRQALMEEWMSTQAQGDVIEEQDAS
jgi:hypothetical protein